jgi:hypothetical protein
LDLGEIILGKRKHFNDYVIEDDIAKIFIIRDNGDLFEVIVDADMIPLLKKLDYCWCINSDNIHNSYARHIEYYISNNGKRVARTYYLHHFIMDGENYNQYIVYDHINHNTLDNRKINLRIVEKQNNDVHRKGRNKNNLSGYRNVSFSNGKYLVQLQVNKKNTVLGSFTNVDEAGRFAEEMRKKYYGEFAGNN